MDKQVPILFSNEKLAQRMTAAFDSKTQAVTGETFPNYALMEDFWLSGGFRICSGTSSTDLYGRNAISYDRRKLGMIVYDVSDGKFWKLINEPVPFPSGTNIDTKYSNLIIDTWPTTDTDWEEVNLLSTLNDVIISAVTFGDILYYSGDTWINYPLSALTQTFSAITYDVDTQDLTIRFLQGGQVISGVTHIPMSGFTGSTYIWHLQKDSDPSVPVHSGYTVEFRAGDGVSLTSGITSSGYYIEINASGVTGETYYQNPNPTTAYLNYEPISGKPIGGIPEGSTFPNPVNVQYMFDMLLYPYLQPKFTEFFFQNNTGPLEVGSGFTTDIAEWDTSNQSNITAPISDSIQISGYNLSTVGNLNKSGTQALTFTSIVSGSTHGDYHTWYIQGKNTNGSYFSMTYNIYWYKKLFWGSSTNTHFTGDPTTLTNSQNEISSTCVKNYYDFAASPATYKYFFFDQDHGTPSNFVDNGGKFNVAMQSPYQVVLTNSSGISCTYNVYRTTVTTSAQLQIIVT